jgi:hypothetical protein
MARAELTHNPLNGVTGAIWREGDVVHKVLTRRGEAPAHWAASDDPRHWNYWRREALVYESALPERLGLRAPRLLDLSETPDGDLVLRLERVDGRHGAELTIDDLSATAHALGSSQGRSELPAEPWLSRSFLRTYSGTRAVDWALLEDDAAWRQPLMSAHFSPDLRAGLLRLRANRERLLSLSEGLPRTVSHLDVWPNNLIRRPSGEVVLLDWAFTGDGAVGEDVGNLVPDSVLDLLFPHDALDELDARLTRAYVRGLRDAGSDIDERIVRLGICASAVKYDWLTVYCLEHAGAAAHTDYGRAATVDAHARYAARAAALALCVRWADEAEQLADTLRR